MYHSPRRLKVKYPSSPVSQGPSPNSLSVSVIKTSDSSVISSSTGSLPSQDLDGYYVIENVDMQGRGITFQDGVQSKFRVHFGSPDGQGPDVDSDVFVPGNIPEPPDPPSEVVVVV